MTVHIHFVGLPGSGKSTISSLLFSYLKQHLPFSIKYTQEQVKNDLDNGTLTAADLQRIDVQRNYYNWAKSFIVDNEYYVNVTENSHLQNRFYACILESVFEFPKPNTNDLIVLITNDDDTAHHSQVGRIHTKEDCLALSNDMETYMYNLKEAYGDQCIGVTRNNFSQQLPLLCQRVVSSVVNDNGCMF